MMPRGGLDVRENGVQGLRVFCGMNAQEGFDDIYIILTKTFKTVRVSVF